MLNNNNLKKTNSASIEEYIQKNFTHSKSSKLSINYVNVKEMLILDNIILKT